MVTETGLPTLSTRLWELFATVLVRTVDEDFSSVLQATADEIIARTQATGVSILCVSGAVARARAGDWPDAARPKLNNWERALLLRVREDLRTLPEGPLPLAVTTTDGVVLCNAPLVARGQVVGALSLCGAVGHENELVEAATSLSPWLGILLHMVQDRELAYRRLGGLGMIFHAGGGPADSEEVGSLLQNTLRLAARLVNAQGCLAATARRGEQGLRCEAAYIPSQPVDWSGATLDAAGILGHVARAGETVLTNDPVSDPRYSAQAEGALTESLSSLVAAPLLADRGPFGVLAALNRADALGFTPTDAWLLENVAAHIAVTLENARLYERMREEQNQIANVQRSIRMDIASNLHQGAIQMLAAVAMELDHLAQLARVKPEAMPEEVEALKTLTREATREARLLLFELRPTTLEAEGLVAAVQAYLKQLPDEGASTRLEASEELPEIDPLTEQVAFAVIVQALRHVRLHGKAQNVWLSLAVEDDSLVIDVEDDGKPYPQRRCGYHEANVTCPQFMREQVSIVQGMLTVRDGGEERRPGIRIQLPIHRG